MRLRVNSRRWNNFTPKEHVAFILACWGALLGVIPPAFQAPRHF
jgi:hypothetical protein